MDNKRYEEDKDINDLVAEDMDPDTFYKGGAGSGQKGHTTNNQSTVAGNQARRINPKISLEAVKQRLEGQKFKHKPIKKSDINDEVETLLKGGEGSGKKGHQTNKPITLSPRHQKIAELHLHDANTNDHPFGHGHHDYHKMSDAEIDNEHEAVKDSFVSEDHSEQARKMYIDRGMHKK